MFVCKDLQATDDPECLRIAVKGLEVSRHLIAMGMFFDMRERFLVIVEPSLYRLLSCVSERWVSQIVEQACAGGYQRCDRSSLLADFEPIHHSIS
jgi:hypothetical protein